jgi:hypothetical protein
MDREQVRDLVNQLVESEFDYSEAQKRLDRFEQTNDPPPRASSEFATLEAFLDFHEAKSRHEGELQILMTQRDEAKALYDLSKDALRVALPENTPLHYDYEGNRQELAGVRFTITNQPLRERGTQITISSSRPADE